MPDAFEWLRRLAINALLHTDLKAWQLPLRYKEPACRAHAWQRGFTERPIPYE